jgi:hypothetical protein
LDGRYNHGGLDVVLTNPASKDSEAKAALECEMPCRCFLV